MMRLSDILTIYCAVGASFAAARFTQGDAGRQRPTRRAAELCVAFAFWFVPLATTLWRGRTGADADAGVYREHEAGARSERKHALVRDTHEQARAALYAVQDEAKSPDAARSARATLERYAGLTLLASDDADSAPHNPLFDDSRLAASQSLAGRSGDDLDCAVRCVARRNRRVLSQHLRRSRTELIEACGVLRRTHVEVAQPDSQSLTRFYERVLELAAVLDDAEMQSALAHIAHVTRGEHTLHDATPTDGKAAPIVASHIIASRNAESRTPRHVPFGSANR